MSLLIDATPEAGAPTALPGPGAALPQGGSGAAADTGADGVRSVVSALGLVDAALAGVPRSVGSYAVLSDAELVAASTAVGRDRDALDAIGVLLAGEIARRSAPGLGSAGLAQRNGFRTPIEMVKIITRVPGRQAGTAVSTGTLLVETATQGTVDPSTGDPVSVTEPWLAPLAGPVAAGEVSLAAVNAIRGGLGRPSTGVPAELLGSAAKQLVDAARVMEPDGLRKLARAARDELDAAGIAEREEERRARRSLRLVLLPDGMGRLIWTLDPETLAVVKDVYDRATSPKLGGVRFIDDDNRAVAGAIEADPRTPEQLASDTFTHLLNAGSDADPRQLLGSGAPVVKVLVTLDDLDRAAQTRAAKTRAAKTRAAKAQGASAANTHPAQPEASTASGHGFFEGHPDPISMATIDRYLELGVTDLIVSTRDGHLVEPSQLTTIYGPDWDTLADIGRDRRLFSAKQRSQLAARDGGCRWPGCTRPPSWCEAHHITFWKRDNGPTTLDNGILLCKHHHLLLHNNGWEITTTPPDPATSPEGDPSTRPGSDPSTSSGSEVGGYWLIPPPDIHPDQHPRPMPSKSPAWARLQQASTS